jgi:hypothetical protein
MDTEEKSPCDGVEAPLRKSLTAILALQTVGPNGDSNIAALTIQQRKGKTEE